MASYNLLSNAALARIIFQNPLSGAELDYVMSRVREARDGYGFGRPDLDEPLTYDKIRRYALTTTSDPTKLTPLYNIYREGLSSGALPSLEADASAALSDATLPGGWVERLVRAILGAITDPNVWKAFSEVDLVKTANRFGLDLKSVIKHAEDFLKDPKKFLDLYIKGNAAGLAYIIEFVSGLGVPTATIQGLLDGSITATDRQNLGKIVYSILTDNLLLDDVRKGFLLRNPGDAEVANLERLFGGLMRLQIGAIALEALEPFLPGKASKMFKTLREAMGDAINLDDAAEDIYQIPIENFINRGLEQKYLREFKPSDLSATQAFQAAVAGKITESDLGKILDNAGYRDDIRQILRDFAATNLTESDINDAYQWNLFTREQVKEQYKNKFFEEEDRELKTKLVEMTRRQKLREKIFELYGNLYRDGVASKDEVRPFLQNYGYDNDEIDMWFSQQELERRQRKWLPINKVIAANKLGYWTDQQAVDYLTIQGMTAEDANLMLEFEAQNLSRGDIANFVASGEMSATEGLNKMIILGYSREDASMILSHAVLEDALRQIPKKTRDACLDPNVEITQLQAAVRVALELNPLAVFQNSHFFTEARCIIENHLKS